jgi:hypothetical protein
MFPAESCPLLLKAFVRASPFPSKLERQRTEGLQHRKRNKAATYLNVAALFHGSIMLQVDKKRSGP